MSKHNRKGNTDRHHDEGSLREKLNHVVTTQRIPLKGTDGRTRYKNPSQWEKDGVDHINIDYFALTEMGKMLEFSYKLPFKHDIFQDFNSISGFWAYIQSEERDDRCRYLVGHLLQEVKRSLVNVKVDHIKAIIMDTAYQRVKGNNKLSQLMYSCELPFDSYKITNQGVFIRHANYEWVVDGYNEIRRAIQSNTTPDFSFLCNFKTDDIYKSIRPVIPEHVKERIEAQQNRIKQRVAPRPTHEVKQKPVAKPATPVAKLAPKPLKPRPDSFVFDKKNGYCLLLPVINTDTTKLFLDHFQKTMTINGLTFLTGPLVAEVKLPLLQISDHRYLLDEGLINDDDIVRAGPVMDKTFQVGFDTNNVIRLDTFVIEDTTDGQINIPLILRVFDKNHERDTDVQKVTEAEDGTMTINREIVVHKQLVDILNEKGEVPTFVKELQAQILARPDADKFRFGVFKLTLTLMIKKDIHPTVYLEGSVKVLGISNRPAESTEKVVVAVPENHFPVFPIAGYTFTLYRGLPRVVTEPAAVAEPAAIVDETPNLVVVAQEVTQEEVFVVTSSDDVEPAIPVDHVSLKSEDEEEVVYPVGVTTNVVDIDDVSPNGNIDTEHQLSETSHNVEA